MIFVKSKLYVKTVEAKKPKTLIFSTVMMHNLLISTISLLKSSLKSLVGTYSNLRKELG